jgi:hypothetical protein
MNEERLQILKMVQQGTITAEEASKLLSALDDGARGPARDVPQGNARWIRVRITDQNTGKKKVNVNIPMGVAEAAVRLGARFGTHKVPEMGELDINEIMAAIRSGNQGKIVDIDDEETGDHVEVSVD